MARWRSITRYYESRGIDLGELRAVRDAEEGRTCRHDRALPAVGAEDLWSRRFPDPVSCFASGWMRVRARARQRGVELPLVISDHADWDGLTATIAATGAAKSGSRTARKTRWCTGARARA